jgi:hypothetical protein
MRFTVYNGTVRHDQPSLCRTCANASIVHGETPDQRIVDCRLSYRHARRIVFRVTSCTDYVDGSQPSYLELLRRAWILRPYAPRRHAAGFVHGRDLSPREVDRVMGEMSE